ncbi:major facilitator superfamily protein [Striga asiatica]|uniref:Major facilitator superfamily protein n=1 Tax=Striga asiatica TaxID=4170 RepID=A0A5A7QXM3_STRAF|nr:major facilitator superfamily protein [Striga asiatica]
MRRQKGDWRRWLTCVKGDWRSRLIQSKRRVRLMLFVLEGGSEESTASIDAIGADGEVVVAPTVEGLRRLRRRAPGVQHHPRTPQVDAASDGFCITGARKQRVSASSVATSRHCSSSKPAQQASRGNQMRHLPPLSAGRRDIRWEENGALCTGGKLDDRRLPNRSSRFVFLTQTIFNNFSNSRFIMIPTLISVKTPFPIPTINPYLKNPKIYCSQQRNSKNAVKECRKNKTNVHPAIVFIPNEEKHEEKLISRVKNGSLQMGSRDMMRLCGLGYYVNGFRGFPWLALNYHMTHNLNMHPSTLQLVQNSANLPMVAKPLYGILSDAIYIGGAHRIPYISIGGKIVSWVSLALIPVASEAYRPLMTCVLLSNLGASLAEVAKDALIAEYGQKNKTHGLQSYAFMASAFGGILGNLIGGFFLLKTQQPKSMFLAFATILSLQLTLCLQTREESLGLPQPLNYTYFQESIFDIIKKQYSDLMAAVRESSVWRPLIWAVSSIILVPMLSGSLFCYQTQNLHLGPSIIGLSKVTGQLMLLSLTVLYNRFGKNVPMRKLVGITQIVYAFSLLLDFVLVKQLNVWAGISNEVYTLCFSGLAETVAQFKLLPFHVLFASLAPPGCEGSLMSFLASALCLSSIIGGFLGVVLASSLGISSGDYSSLPLGILVQFFAALLPLGWIDYVPMSGIFRERSRKRVGSKKSRRNRRVGRVVFDSVYSYRRVRESDLQR